MTKWITIAKHEYMYNVRRKEFLFVTFGLPLFIFAVGLLPVLLADSSTGHEDYRLGYVDRTGQFESTDFTKYADEELAKKDLLDKRITHFFVIPENYTDTGKVGIYSLIRMSPDSVKVEEQIKDFLLDNLLRKEKKEIVERVKNPISSEYFVLNEIGYSEGDAFAFLISIAFAVFFMLSIFTSSNFLLQGVVEEKESRVMEVLLSSVSYRELLVGKIFGLGAVGLTQIFLWLGMARLLSNPAASGAILDRLNISAPLLLFASAYFILGYLAFASIMASVGAVASTSREGQQIAGLFSITGAIPLIIFQFITENPDAILTRILSVFPLTSPITMVMRLSMGAVEFYEIVLSILILTFSTLIILELAVKVFRASLLMYGKKPGVREFIKYLREG